MNQYIIMNIVDDVVPEPDESFFVELTSTSLVSGGQERPCKWYKHIINVILWYYTDCIY